MIAPVFLIAVGVVAFFVIGMSLTIIFKGHYMDSEIGDNKHMKEKGISCTSQAMRREEARMHGAEAGSDSLCSGSCGSCSLNECESPSLPERPEARTETPAGRSRVRKNDPFIGGN